MPVPTSTPALLVSYQAAAEEALTVLLWEAGTTGLEELCPGTMRAHFGAEPDDALLRRLRRGGARSVRREEIPGEDWIAKSRVWLKAQRVGRLLIRPPWSRTAARPGEELLVIDPARAFGTGGHESTRLVLRELLAEEPIGRRVVDVGTGSGLLALAALRLGAREVAAIDIDPEAVAAVLDNAQRNGLAGRLLLARASPEAVRGPYDLVLANLTATILDRLAAPLVNLLATDGTLVVAGLLEADVSDLRSAFERAGAVVARRRTEGEWAALRLVRG